jgi:hypothetical protein
MRLLPMRDINELRILHKPMGLREIVPALIEMTPTNFDAAARQSSPPVAVNVTSTLLD